MTGITDRMDLGYFPLQDHAAGQDGTPVSVRQSLGGARITRMTDPSGGGASAQDSMVVYGRDNSMGTLGDVHPWLFWQTRERGVRGSGSWAQCFGTLAIDGDGYYNTVSGQPFRDDLFKNDTRYAAKDLVWPLGLSRVAKGALLLTLPGTEESGQNDLAVSVDSRLVAPHVAGPGECGTLIVDMQPARELCMSNSITPGIGGRHARLQSLVRVVAVDEGSSLADLGGDGNVVALNYALSGTDQIPGYGAIFSIMDQTVSGPTTGGPPTSPPRGPTTGGPPPPVPGPTTGPHDAQRVIPPGGDSATGFGQVGRSLRGETAIGAGGFGSGLFGSELEEGERSPNTFGAFVRSPTAGHGVAMMAAIGAYGPIHAGAVGDKHRIGTDADGHPVNSAHISAQAYFYRDSDKDGPLLFEGDYPNPSPQPLQAPVHLSWDGQPSHPFVKGSRNGYWRWWGEVPYLVPDSGKPPIHNFKPPTGGGGGGGGGGPGPPTPGGPGPGKPTPGGPRTPRRGGGPPTGGPSGPTTGGKPRPPTGPVTPPGGPTFGRPITPNPGGKRFPNRPPWPPTRPDPSGPTTPGGSGSNPSGPTTPGGRGICTGPKTPRNPNAPPTGGSRGPTKPGGVTPPRVFGPVYHKGSGLSGGAHNPDPASFQPNPAKPSEKGAEGHGEIIPVGDGGPGGGGSQVKDPREHLGRLSGIDPVSHIPHEVPGLVERVGGDTRDSTALYTIFHPMSEGFVSLNFRPQLTVQGYPNFERNPQIPSSVFRLDEAVRPQVLTMRAWGAQSNSTGEWSPVENATLSRARGGTGNGGVIFCPPRFELEDYYGINSGADVDDVTSSRATQGYVLAAPGVAFALGKPNPDGTLQNNAVRIFQTVTGSPSKPLVIEHNGAEVLAAYDDGTDVIVELGQGGSGAVLVPSGTTAQRPATPALGMLRVNTSGSTDAFEFYDATAAAWVTLADADDVSALDATIGLIGPLLNGSAVETVDLGWSESGGTVSATVEADGGGDVQFRFGGSVYTLDCTPAATVALSAGSDTSPTINYVYVTESGGVLTLEKDATSFPSTAHAPIGTFLVQAAASVATDGPYKVHAWTDHAASDSENGHLSHINSKIRSLNATWVSGCASSLVLDQISTTAGVVFQLHPHAMPARDMSAGDPLYITNDPTTPYKRVTDIGGGGISQDSAGVPLTNGRYFNFVLWGVVSEDESDCKLMLNLPDGDYTSVSKAQADDTLTASYSFGSNFVGTAFLITRFTLQYSSAGGGTWTEILSTELRGLAPSTSPGGGAITDHGNLAGLTDNDHTQYALVSAGAFDTLAPTSTVAAVASDELLRLNEGVQAKAGAFTTVAPTSATAATAATELVRFQEAEAAYQDSSANLTALDAVTITTDKMIVGDGDVSWATVSTKSFGRSLLGATDAATARSTLDAQQLDSDLTSIAALSTQALGRSLLTGTDRKALADIIGCRFVLDNEAGNPVRTLASTSYTDIYSHTIPANTLGMVRLHLAGTLVMNDTSQNYAFRLQLGGTLHIGSELSAAISASATRRPWTMDILIDSTGTGTQAISVAWSLGLPASAGSSAIGDIDTLEDSGLMYKDATEDETASLLLEVKLKWQASAAASDFELNSALLEYVPRA